MPEFFAIPAAWFFLLAGLATIAGIGLWVFQREPIEPDPAEVPGRELVATVTWEQVRPYRYVPAHSYVPAHAVAGDSPGRESRLRLAPYVVDQTLADVYRGGQR